jgi:hypothetical protein
MSRPPPQRCVICKLCMATHYRLIVAAAWVQLNSAWAKQANTELKCNQLQQMSPRISLTKHEMIVESHLDFAFLG